jgi:hypothetical protein
MATSDLRIFIERESAKVQFSKLELTLARRKHYIADDYTTHKSRRKKTRNPTCIIATASRDLTQNTRMAHALRPILSIYKFMLRYLTINNDFLALYILKIAVFN